MTYVNACTLTSPQTHQTQTSKRNGLNGTGVRSHAGETMTLIA
jgi:hypothetical protein